MSERPGTDDYRRCTVRYCPNERVAGLIICMDHAGTPPPTFGINITSADLVNRPAHYNTGKIEVIEFIEDQQLPFHLGNAVKYICRAGRKDVETYEQDLQKAIWYIRRRLELLKKVPRRPNEMPNTDA